MVQQENVHLAIHQVDGLLVAGKDLRIHHQLVRLRTTRNHHLLLDRRTLPTELVEYVLEGLHYTRVSMGSVQVELEGQQVIEVPMR